MILAGLYMALVFAPEAANLPTAVERYAQRIMYFHVGSAWVGFFAFFVTFVAGIVYLINRSFFWDNLGYASVEIGLTFMTMVLVTGSIWAKPTWNTWWTWSPRLTISAIGWLMSGRIQFHLQSRSNFRWERCPSFPRPLTRASGASR